ncbi:MAG: DeoR family transcriptional regulator [Sphingobacterium sp.]|nr:DeoR family transcriptional regulator [Sphingobacterium sp.]
MSLAFEQRKKKILDQLRKEKSIQIPDLAEALHVSSETVRRDLGRLEKEGKLKKVYGGAVLPGSNLWEPPYGQKSLINAEEKKSIGRLAATLVEDEDIIMVGNGTTTVEMIDFLSTKKNVTLITYSAPVLLRAMKSFKGPIIFIGGEVDINQESTHGLLAELSLKQLRADKAFIPAGGISIADGINDYDLNEAKMSGLLKERSNELVVVADHSKLGVATFAHICSIKEISTLVTTGPCPEDLKNHLHEHNVQLMLAD